MAFDFLSAYASSDGPFYVSGQATPTLTEAPTQVTLRFSPGVTIDSTTLGSIAIVRSAGANDPLGNGNDVTVMPGSITVNDIPNKNEVVIRFKETLPDDAYRITIGGGKAGLKTVSGDSMTATRSFDIRLDLGAFVVSVVPQPVTRVGNALAQNRDQIAVYFNANDPLSVSSAQTSTSYRLFEIDKATGQEKAAAFAGDADFANPAAVSYDATKGVAVLTFATSVVADDKLYRLQVGGAEARVPAPSTKTEGTDFTDKNSNFATAVGLGTLTSSGATVVAAIDPTSTIPTPLSGVVTAGGVSIADLLYPSQPGSIDEPGHRNLPPEIGNNYGALQQSLAAGSEIPVYAYNFQDIYGQDPQGNDLHNAITEIQKQRAREIFDLFSLYAGIRFVETPGSGITVVTGDVRAISPTTLPDAVGGMGGGAGGVGYAIMSSLVNWGSSEHGGQWFQTAMHEIGHAIGFQHSWDVPSIMGAGLSGEAVFPGDYDRLQVSQFYPATGSDLDVYSFDLPASGRLSAETVVARPGQPAQSGLDSLLTLYREDTVKGQNIRTLVARNDDYYGRDSFIGLDLTAGTYYLTVSSTGNDKFNPEVDDSGYGGRTDGAYALNLGFQPMSSAATTIVDTSGKLLDGDRDGKAGGAFDFWFNTASPNATVFVDKAAAAAAPDGSIAKPYTTIAAALAAVNVANAAVPGSKTLIRIVGNTAGSAGTPLPYLVGTDPAGRALADGATFNVPAGVTAMIDGGAVFKLRAANIDVGSSSALVSREGAALQVLGTPGNTVKFTSYHDDLIGGNSDGVGPAVTGGQWGGLVFRENSDFHPSSGVMSDPTTKQAFVNSVSLAEISYGGGQVNVDAQLDAFAPIQIENTRPTLAFNTILNSAGAAISATPDSFEDSHGRVGPDIRGNTLLGNSTNGLFVKIPTPLGGDPKRLDVSARFRSTDIVYVLQDNLLIAGGAGGYVFDGTDVIARKSGRLAIDPGVILKLLGARIELERGNSQLIAEGTPGQRVVFTSFGDNRFGAGGTFDTNGNLPDVRKAGDWGGIVLDAGSKASIDYAYVAFGGGQTPIEGTLDRFNVIESHQGDLRLAHSRIENNDAGLATTSRSGRGSNVSATVFVRGAQPAIVGNDFRDNLGALISVNANSLTDAERPDPGRSTGTILRDGRFDDNRGPLIRDNRISYTIDAAAGRPAGGAIGGMQVRGEEITVESVWDDTDIVYVLQSEILVGNFTTATGVRLVSRPDASLVVKLGGADAGFTASGSGLDIPDRIGGTVQVVGQPGYAVVLTSLKDDSVGASLDSLGQLTKDTNSDGTSSTASPADWRSLKFMPFSNDTNVAVVLEAEKAAAGWIDVNATPTSAHVLGVLAADQKNGDENRRLGFEVHGAVSWMSPTDVDTYSFTGYSGSEVWIDIDKSSPGLDSMVELLDASGNVVARSADAQTDAGLAGSTRGIGQDLQKDVTQGGDYYSVNPKDPGMRLTLPGKAGASNQYYVRVRSQPRYDTATSAVTYESDLTEPTKVASGVTSGAYELRVRLQQRDQKPGSIVSYADIRFPQVGIDVQGLPQGSPLTGETGETADTATANNDAFGTAQYVGNLLQTDKATISIAGTISTATDVDWYSFALNYEQLESITGVNAGTKSWSTVFDLDYGDGFRGDLTISVFDSKGILLYVGRDSNVASDQGGGTFTDLSRGSAGALDPFIGPAQLPAGSPTGSGGLETGGAVVPADPTKQLRYYVAVSSNEQLPAALDATLKDAATNSLIRLEPMNSVQRVVEDHIGSQGYTSGGTSLDPTTGPMIDTSTAITLAAHVTPFTLSDVTLFVSTATSLLTVDAMRGIRETTLNSGYQSLGDIAMRSDGLLYSYSGLPGTADTAGRLDLVDTGTGVMTAVGNDSITDKTLTTDDVNALAWQRTGVGAYSLFYSVQDGGQSQLFKASSTTTGSASATKSLIGPIQDGGGSLGHVTGMAFLGATLYGVDDKGRLFTIDPTSGSATLITAAPKLDPAGKPAAFAGLTLGPQNLNDGAFKNLLFAIDTTGSLYAFDTKGVSVPVFDTNGDGIADATSIATSTDLAGKPVVLKNVTGLAFSPLDVNLWHTTDRRGDTSKDSVTTADPGHGIAAAGDNSRSASAGGTSMYFGLEQYAATGSPYQIYAGQKGQYGVLSSAWQQDLTSNAAIANTYNVPGGAYGSLTTNSFDLSQYASADRPTLYFNYWLHTPGGSGKGDTMRDSARVFVSIDGGATWEVIATNNSSRSTADSTDAELPNFASVSAKASTNTNQQVQQLYNSASWRQARVDLGNYAGQADIRLRFDFSTAGEFDAAEKRAVSTTVATAVTAQAAIDVADITGIIPGMDVIAAGVTGVTVVSVDATTNTVTLSGDVTLSAGDAVAFSGLINVITGLAGTTGNFGSAERGQDNQYEGFYVDDIIVGFAERGEIVTGAVAGQTGFTAAGTPLGGSPTVATQALTGPYQLEIRPGTTYGVVADPIKSKLEIFQTFDTNEDMVASNATAVVVDALGNPAAPRGDANTPRLQGQFLIQNNIVTSAAAYGISIDAGVRDPNTNAPVPGVPRNLPVLNNSRLVPGVVVANNVVATSGTAAIFFSGDPNTGNVPTAAVPFGKIVNNTIFGGLVVDVLVKTTSGSDVITVSPATTADTLKVGMLVSGPGVRAGTTLLQKLGGGQLRLSAGATATAVAAGLRFTEATTAATGVVVSENAGPTLLNNVFASLATGVQVDGTSSSRTVVAASAFYNTATPVSGVTQSQGITLGSDPFVNAAGGNFYPVQGSSIIDSALNSLQDRSEFMVVTAAVGIGALPILAPERDLYGQLRGDDASQASQPGLGSSVYKDRGGIDRVDFFQPSAALASPLDEGLDDLATSRPNVVVLRKDARTQTSITLQLSDVGVGVDKSSVTRDAFSITWEGKPLVEGTDYVFRFLETSNQVVFESASVFRLGTYVVTARSRVKGTDGPALLVDYANNTLLPNNSDGTTTFSVTLADGPNAPTDLAGMIGDGFIDLTWAAPTADNGSPIFDYEVEYSANGTFPGSVIPQAASATTSRRLSGLVNGTIYSLRVRAVNAAGVGDWSQVISQLMPLATPSIALTNDTGDSTTDGITRDGTVSVGGLSTAAGAVWQYSLDGGSSWSSGTGSAFTITDGVYPLGSIRARQMFPAGNPKTSDVGTNTTAFTVDSIAPSIAITSDTSSIRSGDTVVISFHLSEPSTTFGSDDVTVSGGRLSGFAGSGTTYTADFTPLGAGPGLVSVLAGKFADLAGNPNLSGDLSTPITIDDVSPTLVISSNSPLLRAGQTATLTFTLSEPSTTFAQSDVDVSGGTLSGFAGSGSVYTAIFTPLANSTVAGTVAVAMGAFTDLAKNPSTAAALPVPLSINTITPTVAITSANATLKAGEATTITFAISEATASFTADDVAVVGGLLSGFSGSGVLYTALFTPFADSTVPGMVAVAAGRFTNAIGNGNDAGALANPIAIDTILPGVTISSNKANLQAGEVAVVTFVLSKPSASFTADDITLTGGVLSNFTGSGDTYSANFVPLADSTADGTVAVAAGRFFDAAGNPNTAASLASPIKIDTQRPTVTITSDKSVLRSLRTATITFTLSELLSTFGAEDVSVTGGTLTNFAGSGQTYTAVFTPDRNAMTVGTVRVAAGTFSDAAGNPNVAGALIPPMTIDTIVPTVAISSSVSTLRAGQTAFISFALSEASTTFTAEDVTVTGGTLSSFAGAGQAYTAIYTPLLESTVPGTVKIAARSFFDAAENPNTAAELLPAIVIDTVLPTVAITANKPALRAGETAVVTFTLSKPSTTFTLADVAVAGGSLSAFGGSGTSYTAVFTPAMNSTSAGTVTVAAGGFTDAAGNENAAGFLSPSLSIDTVRPTVTITTDRPILRTQRVANLTFVLNEPSTSFGIDDIVVTGGTLSGFTGSGPSYSAVFTPFNNVTMNGSVSVAEGRFFDSFGNGNLASALSPAIIIDTVVPTIAIASSTATLRTGQTALISFTLSEPSTTFTAEDITVGGGTLSSFGGSGRLYSAVFTPLTGSTAPGTISVAAKAFFDAANNPNAAGSLAPPIVADTVAPSVAITSSNTRLGIGETATLTFTLSEPSTTFSSSAIMATGGTISNFGGGGRSFTATFTPTPNVAGTAVIRVPAARFTDAVGNPNTVARLRPDIVLDTVLTASASANGVVLATTAAVSPSLTTKVRTISVSFNAPVTGFNPSALRIYYTGPSGSTTAVALTGTTITGGGSTYTVTLPATAASLSGLYQLDLGGPGTSIASTGGGMPSKATFYWRRA